MSRRAIDVVWYACLVAYAVCAIVVVVASLS